MKNLSLPISMDDVLRGKSVEWERLEDETVWLTQDHMAVLFGKAKSTINEHIKNIFAEGELVEGAVMKKFGNSEFQQKAPNF